MKECPFCAEDIEDDLMICPFCKRILSVLTPPVPTKPESMASKNIVKNAQTKDRSFYFPIMSIVSYVISIVFMGIGFSKIWVYDSGENYPYRSINAYVGGDAYNYIINSNYAVGYFVLALIFVVLGSTFAITKAITSKQQ